MAKKGSGSGGGGALVATLLIGAGIVAGIWWAVSSRRRAPGNPQWMRRRRRGPATRALSSERPGIEQHAMLRESILGADKGMVQSVFGPPRAAGGMPRVPDAGRQAYWDADTWYYALDPARRLAMAITFKGGVARAVEFVEGDGGG